MSNSGQFKLGNKGGGAPKRAAGFKKLKNLTAEEFVDFGNLILNGRMGDILRMAKDPNSTGLEALVGSCLGRILADGDIRGFNILMDRLIGKVQDKVHVTGDGSAVAKVIVTLPSNGREAKLTAL